MTAVPGDRRDRVVDAARAFAVLVVLLWHWTLSVTHRDGEGRLVMPNLLHTVPGGWAATWVLQVVPLFFLVGGYANLAALQAARARGDSACGFVLARLRRLLVPTAVWACVWAAGEVLVALAAPGTHVPVWEWFPGVLTPLWFLAVYTLLVVTVPLTAAVHERSGHRALLALAGLVVLGSVAHRALSWVGAGWVTAALVWLFVHQLGYAWRTRDPAWGRPGRGLALAGTGLGVLALLTTLGGFPRSMVATAGEGASNMLPTSAAVAALAVLQLGLLLLATPLLERALQHPVLWTVVAAVNAVALTVFLWHMTAYLAVVLAVEAAGGTLGGAPTPAWWAERWLWLLAPAAVLAAVVAALGRVEAASRRPRAGVSSGRPTAGRARAGPGGAARRARAGSGRGS